jgi:DNA (cytosine-5)-methyltransferase 1
MSVGVFEAAMRLGMEFDVALAVDSDPAAVEVFKQNFPDARAVVGDVASLFAGAPGQAPTPGEVEVIGGIGEIDVLMGGPPCQGHSDLNNHTRREDPKNALYLRMARAAELLNPSLVLIENVPPVQWDRNGVVEQTANALRASGYSVAGGVINLARLGIPQRRRRFLLIASRSESLSAEDVLDFLRAGTAGHADRTVRWATEDLLHGTADGVFDTPSTASAENRKRMSVLFDNDVYDLPNAYRPPCHRDGDHSYRSVYGRLKWDEPAQTITTGYGSMGQGRYVHPSKQRTITPHEAARLQTFPDWFTFGTQPKRGVLAKFIGNAVPPLLTRKFGDLLVPKLLAGDL